MDGGRKNRRKEEKKKRKAGGGREGWEEGKEEKRKKGGWKKGCRMEGRLVFLLETSFQVSPVITSLKGTGSSSVWLLAEGYLQNPDLNGMCKAVLRGLGARQVGVAPWVHFLLPRAVCL